MIQIFNLDVLVRVSIFDKQHAFGIHYRPFKKSFFGNQQEGFYTDIFNSFLGSKDDVAKNGYLGVKTLVIGDVAYFRPYVILSFAGGYEKHIKFETYKDALEYGQEMANNNINSQLVF